MMKPEFEALALANVAEGQLEALFQESLDEASDVFENADRFERGKDDVTTVRITLEIELSRQGTDPMVDTNVRATVKRPKRKRVGRSVFYKPGEFTATKVRQADLFEAGNVTPLRSEESN